MHKVLLLQLMFNQASSNNGLVIMQNTTDKANLQKMKVSATKQDSFVQTEINFVLGKNEDHTPH